MEKRTMRDVVSAPDEARASRLDSSEMKTEKSSFFERTKMHSNKRVPLDHLARSRKGGSGKFVKILMVIAAIVLLGFLIANFQFKATVNLTPRSEAVTLDASLTAFKDDGSQSGGLTYRILEKSAERTITLQTAGTSFVERKTSGEITVFNDFDGNEQQLVKNTRFEAPDGKIYRINKALSIPGRKIVNGETVPGSVTATVYADEAGESYNRDGATRFAIPGFKGTDRYDGFYARSTDSFTGGFRGEVGVISDADLASAEQSLQNELTAQLLTSLTEELAEGELMLSNIYSVRFVFKEFDDSDAALSADASSREVTGVMTLAAPVFNNQMFSNALANTALSISAADNVSIQDTSNISVTMDDFEDIDSRDKIELFVDGQTTFVWIVDQDKLKDELAGIKKNEHSSIFVKYPAIDRAEVTVRPFWRSSLPKKASRIEIIITNP